MPAPLIAVIMPNITAIRFRKRRIDSLRIDSMNGSSIRDNP
jgi:hypothetical protein